MVKISKKTRYDSFQALLSATKERIDILLAIALGIFWHVYITLTGLSISPDSGYFLSSALRFHYAGDYFLYAVRPPLYPFLIHLSMFFKKTPAEAAALLGGLTMLGVLVVFALILRRFSKDQLLNSLFILLLFTFRKFLYVFAYVWTEGLFCLFLLLAVYLVIRHWETNKIIFYIFGAISVSFVVLTRYMGYSLVAVFFLYTVYYVWSRKDLSKVSKLKYFAWNSLSYVPLLLYITRNYFVSHTFHGIRQEGKHSIFQNFYRATNVLDLDFSFYFTALVVLSLVVYFFLLKVKGEKKKTYGKSTMAMTFGLVFMVFYTGLMIYTTSTVIVDPIATRYFSPVYPIFFLFIFLAIRSIPFVLESTPGPVKNPTLQKVVTISIYCFIIASLLGQLPVFGKFMDFYWAQDIQTKKIATASGYNRSSIPEKFSQYFASAFEKTDLINVSTVCEYRKGIHNFYLGIVPFFIEKNLKNKDLGDYSYYRVQHEEADRQFPGFNILFNSKKGKKHLRIFNLPRGGINRRLFRKLNTIMQRHRIKHLLLIVNTNGKNTVIGNNLSRFLPYNMQTTDTDTIGNYKFYQLIRNPEKKNHKKQHKKL